MKKAMDLDWGNPLKCRIEKPALNHFICIPNKVVCIKDKEVLFKTIKCFLSIRMRKIISKVYIFNFRFMDNNS